MAHALFLLLLLLSVCPFSSALGEDAALPVEDAIRQAVENNLDLQVQTFAPAIAETGILGARGIYDTRMTALLDHRGQESQVVPGSSTAARKRYFDFDAGFQKLVPSGGTASLSFNNAWFADDQGTAFSRSAEPQLSLSFSQPILQGLGRDVTERGITLAQDSADTALADWRQKAESTASTASTRFYDLYKARENLETRKASLAVAQRIHEENQARVKAGVLASYQLLDSELGVLSRETDLLASERARREAADNLRVFLQRKDPAELVPVVAAAAEKVDTTEERAPSLALRKRPELVKARVAVRSVEFSEKVSGNLALPSLALAGTVGVTGLGKSYGDGFGDMSSGKYPNWSVGINFSFPLGNSSAMADLESSRLKAAQARVALRSAEEAVALEVRTALRALETRYRQVEVARKGVAVAAVRFESYEKRQKLGLATTKDLLDAESQLVAAKEGLTGTLADYQVALTEYYRSTGDLLDRHNLRIDGRSAATKARKGAR
jgi:outer membrane protein